MCLTTMQKSVNNEAELKQNNTICFTVTGTVIWTFSPFDPNLNSVWINLPAYTCIVCVHTHSAFSFQKPVQVIFEHVAVSYTNIPCFQLNTFWAYKWLYWNCNYNLKRNILTFHSLRVCRMTMHRKNNVFIHQCSRKGK